MKFTSLFISICCTSLPMLQAAVPVALQGSKSYRQEPICIRALLKGKVTGALIEAKGAYKVINPLTGELISNGYRSKRAAVQNMQGGIRWGEGFPGLFQIKIMPAEPTTTILVDGIEYLGGIEIFSADGLLHIINEVDVESYLKSILTHDHAHRKLKNASFEALAIAYRTDLYHTLMRSKDQFFQTDANISGYTGFAATLINTKIDQAVDNTRGEILTYEGQPFPTAWTEHSGGQTAAYSELYRQKFNSPPGVALPIALRNREMTRWTNEFSKLQFASLFQFPSIKSIDLFVEQESQKVYAIRLSNDHASKDISFKELQPFVKSSIFDIKLTQDKVIFTGYGKGPGIGLCLYTMEELAHTNETTSDLLRVFYPSCIIDKPQSLPNPLAIKLEADSDLSRLLTRR